MSTVSEGTWRQLHHILCVPSHAASTKEMLQIAAVLAASGRYRVTFVIRWKDSLAQQDAVRAAGHQLLLVEDALQSATAPSVPPDKPRPAAAADGRTPDASPRRRRRKFKGALRHVSRLLLLETLLRYRRYRRRYGKAVALARQILDTTPADLLLLPSDRLVGLETALLAEAQKRQIPSLVIPWAISSSSAIAYLRQRQPDWRYEYGMQRAVNRYVARKWPQLAWKSEGESLLFLPGEAVLAAQALGIMPPDPWRPVGQGGLAMRMAVEGEHARQEALQAGADPQRIVVTGRAAHDQLHRVLQNPAIQRESLRRSYGLAPEKMLVVLAVPQLAEHHLCSWQEQHEEISFLFGTLGRLDHVQTIASLHPKSRPVDYAGLAAQHHITLANEPIEQLLPVCDLFVATFSSTVVMAIGCGKPVIVLDLYGMSYGLFDDCPGVVTVRSRRELQQTLQRFVQDRNFYERLVDHQRQAAPHWALIDGQASGRLLAEVDQLVLGTQPASGAYREAA